MQTDQMIQSRFLKKENFPQPQIFTIRTISLEEVGGDDKRWVLWLNEHEKGLVLNVTKIRQLEAIYGKETDHWAGRKVRLSHDPNVMYAGKMVGGIKLETPSAQQAPPPPAKDEDFDDDIPF